MNISERKTAVATDSLIKSEFYYEQENYGRAFAHYMVYLELSPNSRAEHEEQFANILELWCLELERLGKYDFIKDSYYKALMYFPTSELLLNNLGTRLLRLDQPATAKLFLSHLLATNINNLPGEKKFIISKINAVQRWHFRMLNDFQRNDAYRLAIQASINNNHNKVIDVGAGCGILSLFASGHEQIDTVVALEQADALIEVATNVLRENHATNIRLIHRNSANVTGSEIGLSTLLITEIFDAGLFGEGILKVLSHAWSNILDQSAKIVPASANLFITGITSSELRRKFKCETSLAGIDFSELCITAYTNDPYEAENLQITKIKYVTETRCAMTVDFQNSEDIYKLFTQKDATPIATLNCVEDGIIDAFAIWFDLLLNENITITTNPFKNNIKCWEQAVIHLKHPICVKKNQKINLCVSCCEERLQVEICDEIKDCKVCTEISANAVSLINDTNLIWSLERVADEFSSPDLKVLDLFTFPIFGLIMAKNGAKVQCVVKHKRDKLFLKQLCIKNKISNLSVTCGKLNKFSYNNYDLIMFNPIARDGTVNDKNITDAYSFTNIAKILPLKITIILELIESDLVDYYNKVISDDSLGGYKIAQYMNDWAVPEQWDIEPQKFIRKSLSKPFKSAELIMDNNEPYLTDYLVPVATTGKIQAILYWYEIEFCNGVVFDTYNSNFYNCASFIIEPLKEVKKGEFVKIKVKQQQNLIKIFI